MGDDPGSADAYLLLLPNTDPYVSPLDPAATAPAAPPPPASAAPSPPPGATDRYSKAQVFPWSQVSGPATAEEEPRLPTLTTKTSFQFWWEHELDPVLHSLQEFFR